MIGESPTRRVAASPYRRVATYALASLALVTPCFWQARIQAGDLGSHLYNAWLAQLVEKGQAPGVTIAPQWSNMLFDLALSGIFKLGGARVAERAAVSLAVLIFAWGAFALVSATARREPWFLLPCLAMLSYGWVFHVGFFNFYLSLGLSLWALAWLWQPTPAKAVAAAGALALAAMGHLLPVAWAAGAIVYGCTARRLKPRFRPVLAVAGVAVLVAARCFIVARWETVWWRQQLQYVTGVDQLWVYGPQYFLLQPALLLLWAIWLTRVIRRRGWMRITASVPFGVWLLTAVVVAVIPSRILLPGYRHALVFISERMSLCAAVAVCALVAAARPRRVEMAALPVLAALFFAFLYIDGRAANRAEDGMEAALAGLPPYQRVVSAVKGPAGRLDLLAHSIDRACIGQCFSYANYEPSTAQFRLRAAHGSPVVVADYADSFRLQAGGYVVKPQDTPIYGLFARSGQEGFALRLLQPSESFQVSKLEWEKSKWVIER
jgi:hypothetical protein